MINGRHENDESFNESKTENFEKLTEIFRKQGSAAKEIKTWTAKSLLVQRAAEYTFKKQLIEKILSLSGPVRAKN